MKWTLAAGLLLLTACSHSHHAETKFAKYANTIPSVQTPAGIKNPTGESYYPIPPITLTQPVGSKPPVTPPGSHLVIQKNATLPAPQ